MQTPQGSLTFGFSPPQQRTLAFHGLGGVVAVTMVVYMHFPQHPENFAIGGCSIPWSGDSPPATDSLLWGCFQSLANHSDDVASNSAAITYRLIVRMKYLFGGLFSSQLVRACVHACGGGTWCPKCKQYLRCICSSMFCLWWFLCYTVLLNSIFQSSYHIPVKIPVYISPLHKVSCICYVM